MRKKVKPGQKLPVVITASEREMIREDTFYDPDFAKLAECRGKNLMVPMTLDDIEDLQGHVAAAANHCEKRKLQARLDRLFDKLQRFLDQYEEE